MTSMSRSLRPLLLRSPRICDPSQGMDYRADVLVKNGAISSIGEGQPVPPKTRVIDCTGLWLWPGLVDPHVHFRDPGFTDKEDLGTGGRAAAAGGYTAVVCEPNTRPPLDTRERARDMLHRAARESDVRVFAKGAMTEGRAGGRMADLSGLSAVDGVVAFSDDGDPVVDQEMMARVCREASCLGLPLSPHCEDSPASVEQYDRGADPGFEPGEPYTNEWRFVRRDLECASRHGCRIHFSHVSQLRSVEQIRRAREGTAGVTYEVTPHHLVLCREDYSEGDAPVVNPPLGTAEDREALRRAVAEGEADAIGSDHAPHRPEDKAQGASGLIGLETTLGVIMTELVHEGTIAPMRAAQLLSTGPASIFDLPGGSLRPGESADMVLIAPGEYWTVDADQFRSKSRNTPFDGRELKGRAVATFLEGERIFETPAFPDRVVGRG